MASKNQEAAEKAVRKSQQVNKAERTTEQVIADIGKNAAAGLSVTSADILLLLSEYRRQLSIVATRDFEIEAQVKVIDVLTAKNDEFRAVYEQENRSATIAMPVSEGPEFAACAPEVFTDAVATQSILNTTAPRIV